jgi:hypothetical protein
VKQCDEQAETRSFRAGDDQYGDATGQRCSASVDSASEFKVTPSELDQQRVHAIGYKYRTSQATKGCKDYSILNAHRFADLIQ